MTYGILCANPALFLRSTNAIVVRCPVNRYLLIDKVLQSLSQNNIFRFRLLDSNFVSNMCEPTLRRSCQHTKTLAVVYSACLRVHAQRPHATNMLISVTRSVTCMVCGCWICQYGISSSVYRHLCELHANAFVSSSNGCIQFKIF